MQKLSKRTRVYIIIGACILILVAILYFVLRPQIIDINSKIVDIKKSKLKLAQLENKEKNVGKLEKDYKEVTQRSKYLYSAIPTEKGIIDFIKELEKIAASTHNDQALSLGVDEKEELGTFISEEKPVETEEKERKDFIEYQINLTGPFHNLMKYIVYFEHLKYYTDITSLEIKVATPQSGAIEDEKEIPKGTLKTTLNAKVYIR